MSFREDNEERLLTRNEAAAYCGITWQTLKYFESIGKFPPARQLTHRRVGYLLSELRRWMRSLPLAVPEKDLPEFKTKRAS